mgnify:CR=1 FL=1
MIEIWKPVKGHENLYEISNLGNLKRLERHILCSNGTIRIIKEKCFSNKPNKYSGYVNVNLSKNGVKTTYSIHRLVAEHFIGNPHNYKVVNHLDEDRANNIVQNLEWTTHAKNLAHNGTVLNGQEKITKKVGKYDLLGALVRTDGYARTVKDYGFQTNAVTTVCLVLNKRHYGFVG